MSKIDELIKELCPAGVEFKALGDMGVFVRGNGLQKADLRDEGVPAVHYGQIHTHYGVWATETKSYTDPGIAAKLRHANPGDLLIATTSEDDDAVAKATAWLGESDAVLSGDAYIYRHEFEPKYVAYFFQSTSFQDQKRRYISGTKVRRISGDSLSKVRIPVPPLEVQREIVRVLDQFTRLKAELEAELEARRRQYEHYRQRLLVFDSGVEWSALGRVADFRRGSAMTIRSAVPGEYRLVANSPDPIGTHNESNREGEFVVIARSGAGAGTVSLWDGPLFLTDAFSLHPDLSVVTTRFVYYLLQNQQAALREMKAGGGVPHVRVKEVETYRIPIPALSEQRRIVGILDKFDALVNDLSIGLPAELSARRKQYEHYRDKLLTFKEAG